MKQHIVGTVVVLLRLALVLACVEPTLGESVALAWSSSLTTNVTGYYVYYGLTGTAATRVDVGNRTTATVSGLQSTSAYFFYATAYDTAGGESVLSEVLSYRVNVAPIASNLAVQAFRNQPSPVMLAGSDSDGDALTFQVLSGPAHGALSGSAPNLSYTPATDYVGTDTFTYKASDGKADSAVATVSISIVVPPDLAAPTVSIAAPVSGSIVSGTVTISVGASDNVGLARIELYRNGALVGTAANSPASFMWNTSTTANGNYTLQAKAFDAAGNAGTSSPVSVSVQNDTTAPTVNIQSPTAGSTISDVVSVTISATDNVGISRIEYYLDGALVGNSPTSPAVFTWDTRTHANGTASLVAKAFDAAGNAGTSSPVSVSVQNDTTAPTVNIQSPTAGSTISGVVSVTISATDNVGISRIEYYLDGALVGNSPTSPAVFTWDTRTHANGTASLVAKAFDAAGNAGTSSPVSVSVQNDTTAPTVNIQSPTAGSTISGVVSVTISARITWVSAGSSITWTALLWAIPRRLPPSSRGTRGRMQTGRRRWWRKHLTRRATREHRARSACRCRTTARRRVLASHRPIHLAWFPESCRLRSEHQTTSVSAGSNTTRTAFSRGRLPLPRLRSPGTPGTPQRTGFPRSQGL